MVRQVVENLGRGQPVIVQLTYETHCPSSPSVPQDPIGTKLAHLLHKSQQKKLNNQSLSSAYERVLTRFPSFRLRGPDRNEGGGRRVPAASDAHIAGQGDALAGGGAPAAARQTIAQQ